MGCDCMCCCARPFPPEAMLRRLTVSSFFFLNNVLTVSSQHFSFGHLPSLSVSVSSCLRYVHHLTMAGPLGETIVCDNQSINPPINRIQHCTCGINAPLHLRVESSYVLTTVLLRSCSSLHLLQKPHPLEIRGVVPCCTAATGVSRGLPLVVLYL